MVLPRTVEVLGKVEPLKSALYLRLKKLLRTFFNEKLTKMFGILKQSHSAEKRKKRGPFGFLAINWVQKFKQNNQRGNISDIKKFRGEKCHNAKKACKTKLSELPRNERSGTKLGYPKVAPSGSTSRLLSSKVGRPREIL